MTYENDGVINTGKVAGRCINYYLSEDRWHVCLQEIAIVGFNNPYPARPMRHPIQTSYGFRNSVKDAGLILV
jgi:hypothetical protein